MTQPHEGTNGTPSNGAVRKPAPTVLEKYRIQPGENVFCVPLADKIPGVFTHYVRGRSLFCAGKDCNPMFHKTDKIWKGYLPVLIHITATKIWKPFCLEVTEHLELDMRHILRRGQTWEIFRLQIGDGKKPAVEGKLHDDPIKENLPKAFDVLPVVRNLYHLFDIELTQKNPLPDRVMVEEFEMDQPVILAEQYAKANSYKDNKLTMAELLAQRNAAKKTPTEKKLV